MRSSLKLSAGVAGVALLMLGVAAYNLSVTTRQPPPERNSNNLSPTAGVLPQSATTASLITTRPAATERAPTTELISTSEVVKVHPEGSAERGVPVFRAWCNSCHPNGQEGYGPALWGNGASWSPETIRNRIRHTSQRERDRFASLSDEKLNDIIAYIQAQQRASN